MRSKWKRLATAALLSLSCSAGTWFWYKSTSSTKSHKKNEEALAQVARVGDEVSSRPAERLLWHTLNTGDYLYNGEAVKTSSRGEIRIQFEDGRFIDLEGDSYIVLQKSKGEISLDLMEGSLFVNAKAGDKGGSSPGLVLNSANGKVDLSGASASLSKNSGSGVNLQVLEGKAKIQDKDGQSKEISSGSSSTLGANGMSFDNSKLQILSPSTHNITYIDPDAEKPVSFKWKGFPAEWKVSVHIGPTRKELKDWTSTEQSGQTEILTKLALGKYYWKLTAKDATGKQVAESPIYRADFQARFAPTMIFPTANAELPIEKAPFELSFQWQKGEESNRVVLEVSADKDLKTKLLNKAFTTEETYKLSNLKEGEYYWRMSAFYPDSDKPTLGKIQKFKIFKLVKTPPKEPVQITWTIPENLDTQYYYDKPTLQISWEPKNRKEEITHFKISIEEEQGSPENALKYDVKETKYKANLTKGGRYLASIEAMDKDGKVIGKSEPRKLAAIEMPLLPAPKIFPEEGVIRSSDDGRSELKWDNIQGAKEYQLSVSNKDGKELAKRTYTTNSVNLKNLMPGEYQIKVFAVDQYGRFGQEPTPRTLVVPNKSNLKPPTLKKIKVN